MNARRRYSYFREHAPLEPSSWRLLPIALLAAFDIWAIVYFFVNLFKLWNMR